VDGDEAEPGARLMRPTQMRTVTTISALLVLVLLGGCGEEQPGTAPGRPAQWGDCTVDAFDRAGGREVATLSGGGTENASVRLVPAGDGPCAGGLVARTGAGVDGLDAGGLDLDVRSAQVVDLEGGGELLLVNGGSHPRGGFQPHVFALSGGLHEVQVDGNPLLPFVATDGGGTPATATCRDDGGVDVLAATTSEPPGVVLAWDVQRTSYRLEHGEATRIGTKQVRDHTADPVLRDEMPTLFEPDGFFSDCRSSSS
jgi:hypothetical protein